MITAIQYGNASYMQLVLGLWRVTRYFVSVDVFVIALARSMKANFILIKFYWVWVI